MKKNELKRAKNEWLGELLVSWTNLCKRWTFFGICNIACNPWDTSKDEEAFNLFSIIFYSLTLLVTLASPVCVYGAKVSPEIEAFVVNMLNNTPFPIFIFFAVYLIMGLVFGPMMVLFIICGIIQSLYNIFENQLIWIYDKILVKIATIIWIGIILTVRFLDWITGPLFTWGVYSKKRYERRTKKKRGKKK